MEKLASNKKKNIKNEVGKYNERYNFLKSLDL